MLGLYAVACIVLSVLLLPLQVFYLFFLLVVKIMLSYIDS